MCKIWEHVPNCLTPLLTPLWEQKSLGTFYILNILILISVVVLTLIAPNQGGNSNLIIVLTLWTANQEGNFHNIVVITQIRGVIRSFWGHNKTHFSFGIGNILPDPPHKMFLSLNLGMSETPPSPLFGPCSQILHIFIFVMFPKESIPNKNTRTRQIF